MPHSIAEPCIGVKDASCVDLCPVDCIHPTTQKPEFEQAAMLYIEPDTCIDRGAPLKIRGTGVSPVGFTALNQVIMSFLDLPRGLCVDECPVEAIFPEEDLPEQWTEYIDKDAAYYQ